MFFGVFSNRFTTQPTLCLIFKSNVVLWFQVYTLRSPDRSATDLWFRADVQVLNYRKNVVFSKSYLHSYIEFFGN